MSNSTLSAADARLLSALRLNARASVSELARNLGLSRSTVHTRIKSLENRGIIKGYRVELGAEYQDELTEAHVLIKLVQQMTRQTDKVLQQMSAISALQAVSGEYDLIAIIQAPSLPALSAILDEIGVLPGVERTTSLVVLETRLRR
ncbi:MAG: Lrp/AsnC family transcriptional regulator [Halieaceae bacterium]|nr:Lrp/AsnC family transcriptional regulator [Halieaceae bacterium]